ncbi:MAG: autotransporter outer membrane beta-barrel domain-containing protein [Campylobacteraceae bacterium]|nr:autotransporter outer membrane beta-barrel domain-containing protein [Campylobacteraceae bacterium]
MGKTYKVVSLFFILQVSYFLYADNISVDSFSFTYAATNANDNDVILLDDGYSFSTSITDIKNIFIYANNSVLNGDNINKIIESAGDMHGFADMTLKNGYGDFGGAVHIKGDLSGNIYNSHFIGNTASTAGGALHVYNDFAGHISNASFLDNGAQNYGGAIVAANLFSGTVSDSVFDGNTVYDYSLGGGAVLIGKFTGDIVNSYFSSNIAFNGGAVYIENSNGTIKDTSFINNRAHSNGGAIYLHNGADLTLHSTDFMQFASNQDQSGSNAIFFNNDGNTNSALNIIVESDAVMDFEDSIKTGGGTLNVTKNGSGTLIYNAYMSYVGETNINEGILLLNNNGYLVSHLNIGDEAVFAVSKSNSYSFSNANINRGVLDIDLRYNGNFFSFADSAVQQNFNGTLLLSNAYYDMLQNGDYTLALRDNSLAYLNSQNSTLKNLVFDGGTLDMSRVNFAVSDEAIMRVGGLNITSQSSIIVSADIREANITQIPNNANLYDYSASSDTYQIINAANGTNGVGDSLSLINISEFNQAVRNITQNSQVTGEAIFESIPIVKNDGIYIGTDIKGVRSLTNVMFDSSAANNNTLNLFLTGDGNFTFEGAKTVYMNNYRSDYTGSTFLKENTHIVAIDDHAFGYTNGLNVADRAMFDLNSRYQDVYGDLNNNGSVNINNGYMYVRGGVFNDGTIDLGSYGSLDFNGGALRGDNALKGYGYLYINGDLNIEGINDNLYVNSYVYGGTTMLDSARGLGTGGYIGLYGGNIAFDIVDSDTLFQGIYGNGYLIKEGAGSLSLNEAFVRLADVRNGTLVLDMNSFGGDVNVSSDAKLELHQQYDVGFSDRFFGSGNITQRGSGKLILDSDSSSFTGVYSVINSELVLSPSASLGGDIRAENSGLVTYGQVSKSITLQDSYWQLNSQTNITSLNLTNSHVYLGPQSDGFDQTPAVTLSMEELNGGGDFYQRLDIKRTSGGIINEGDLIAISKSSSGDYNMHFSDYSTGSLSYPADENIVVVKQDNPDGDYKASFNGQVDIGGYTYALRKSPANNNIILTSSRCTNAACASLSFPSIHYILSYANTETIFERMGAVSLNASRKNDVWIKTYFGKFDLKEEAFGIKDAQYYGTNIGIESLYESANIVFGLSAGFAKASADYKIGGAEIESYDASIYAVFKNEDDLRIGSLLKYNKNKNHFNTKTSNGFAVNGDARNTGMTLSAEVSRRYTAVSQDTCFEPHLQLIFSRQNTFDVYSSNGLKTSIDGFDSLRGRIGVSAKTALSENVDFYIKTGYIKEFGAKTAYSFNDSDKKYYDIKGSFFDNAAGITSTINGHNLYLEGAHQVGDILDNTKISFGYKYVF